MRLAVCRAADTGPVERAFRAPAAGAAQIRFGDELVLYAEEAQWSELVATAERSGAELREHPAQVAGKNLHFVIQNGRVFQQENPDVPVIFDRGRYLLVDIEPERVRSFGPDKEPCFAVRPVADQTVAFESRASRAGQPLPWVQEIVDRVKVASFKADLTHLVHFPTRFATSTHFAEAAAWVHQQLVDLGYQAEQRPITVPNVPGGTGKNVIADKPGTGAGDRELVLVTAHLDSINQHDGPAAPAPGADDNGSGSAGLLELARAFQNHRGAHDLRLIFFGGEELGLHGSKQYVASLTAPERARIRAVVNMDMIATKNTPDRAVLIEGATVSQAVIDGLAEAGATYTNLKLQTSLNAADSDHVPFIRRGLPAVLTIEGSDRSNGNVHTANDTLATIDDELALQILRMNAAFVANRLGRVGQP